MNCKIIHKLIIIITIVCFFVIGTECLWAQDDSDGVIRWEKISGASGYFVQIRTSSKRIIINKFTRDNYIKINLSSGLYEMRVSAANKFRKPARWSSWVNLTIRRLVEPEIVAVTPDLLEQNNNKTTIIITGKNFMQESSIRVLYNGEINNNYTIIERTATTLKIVITTSNFEPGRYILSVVNPGGAIATYGPGLSITGKTVTSVAKTPKQNIKNKEQVKSIPWDGNTAYFSVSANYYILQPEFSDVYDNSFKTFTFNAGLYLGVFANVPIVRNMGIAFTVQYAEYEKLDNPEIVDSTLTHMYYAPGFFFFVPFNNRFDINFILYLGMVKTTIDYSTISESFTAESSDPFIMVGITPHFYIAKHFFAEAGIFYKNIFYTGNSFSTVQITLGCGMIF